MEKQRQIKILSIVALVLAISAMTIGFAAFSTTLNISSSASVTPNNDSFVLKFSTNKDSLVEADIEPAIIHGNATATNGKINNLGNPTISNLSATFTEPGQFIGYSFYVRNEGLYTAYLNSINFIGEKVCTPSDGTSEELVRDACKYIEVGFVLGNYYNETTQITGKSIESKNSQQVNVQISYSNVYVDGPFTVSFPNIALVYSTVDDPSIQPSTQSKVCTYVDSEDDTGSALSKIDLSDVVTCGTESFYVMSNENGKVTMLSMYNLHVGNSVDEDWNVTPLSNPTGIQDSDARGYVEGEYPYIGSTAFSDTDSTYSGSIVEGYVNNYKTYLTNMGVDISSARLITKSELEKLGCSSSSNSCSGAPSWVYSTPYWSGSAYFTNDVWYVDSSAFFGSCNYDYDYGFGVRPVIEISESEIK